MPLPEGSGLYQLEVRFQSLDSFTQGCTCVTRGTREKLGRLCMYSIIVIHREGSCFTAVTFRQMHHVKQILDLDSWQRNHFEVEVSHTDLVKEHRKTKPPEGA